LIAWSIEHAKNARGVSSVWVTSDSEEILRVAMDYGARPIKRPDSLSGDTASSESAWLHALDEIELQEKHPADLVLAMQATSPLRESKDIDRAIEDLRKQDCDSLFACGVLEDFYIWTRQ